jgi:ATP-dependent Lhr-like helicase
MLNTNMVTPDPLGLFLPPVERWFRSALGEPTPVQVLGWPSIAAGRHSLLLAPTGSGKTLAAFLACLDALWRTDPLPRGVQVLYISPLKALNNDIHRNLQVPLQGVAEAAQAMGFPLPVIETAVRTGDTTNAERQRQIRRPPHVLITTPESLHLLLTSRGREVLLGVRWCIVDEIHALCSNKRGVFLALLLERLNAIQRRDPTGQSMNFVRIGLSATQRPLEEVARYLGGAEADAEGRLTPRSVAILDAGLRKDLDLQVVCPVEHFGPQPERSVWPSIYRLLDHEIRSHRSTLVFANDRRAVERITACLNEEQQLARAHHGSVSLEVRQQIEAALKEGRLPAVVATASLELGIDMGAIDLVMQVQSPGNVARALQRVGRAGHLVGQTSKGRLVPRTAAELLEQAVLAREMAAGRVEELRVPINCLDVLAQQLVAMAAVEDGSVPDLYRLVRQAYPYRSLSPQAFETTLEMISGRYRFQAEIRSSKSESRTERPAGAMQALQPRVSWDRVHNRLRSLPGSQQMALVNGGTIPDTGQYAAYTPSRLRIGELDEEFVYERRIGDTFRLGTSTWRLERIEADHVVVTPAEGTPAMIPFWRGENAGRSPDLGRAVGAFLRELTERLETVDCKDWLRRECFLDAAAAENLRYHVLRQKLAADCVPTDRTLLVEASRDPLGDWQVLLLSPLGSRLHLSLRLALEASLTRRLGYRPQCLHHDDGILIRQSDTDEPVLDLFCGLTPEGVEEQIIEELADSALFALRFRQNAARALLLPRSQPGKRSPLWLQRLRGRDLLQVARRHPDFPVVAETFRECLHDHLDVPALRELLQAIRSGEVKVVTRRADVPSPFAGGLLFAFTAASMYESDQTEASGHGTTGLDRTLLEQLVTPEKHEHLLDPRAVTQVERRLRGQGHPPRCATELAELLRRLGDLTPAELEGPATAFMQELQADGRAVTMELPGVSDRMRWITAEEEPLYREAFGLVPAEPQGVQEAAAVILARFLQTHALVGLADVLARYPFERGWAQAQLEEWARSGRAVIVQPEAETMQWSAPENLEQVQRGSLAILRREVITAPPHQFADFLLRWQGLHPDARRGRTEGLASVLQQLEGLPLPWEVWEQWVLPARVPGYQPRWLDDWIAGGAGAWVGQGEAGPGIDRLAFLRRETLLQLRLPQPESGAPSLDEAAGRVRAELAGRGASFVTDLALAVGLTPAAVRAALWSLVRGASSTNDRLDVVRRGEQSAPAEDAASRPGLHSLRASLRSLRSAGPPPEGRWSLLSWGSPDTETVAVLHAALLLQRYGIVARELALQDPWLLPWRVLYEVLSRMELAGEVRRGWFVEGLSGAQFALPEAAQQLQDLGLPSTAGTAAILVHSQDPANLYGAGAPLDVPLLDGGTRTLLRRPGNWLVLRAGRPVLVLEQHGRKITALPSAGKDDLAAAVGCLAGLQERRAGSLRGRVTVDEWNGQPVVSSPGRELLEAAGFVRDYQALTLWASVQ